MPRNVTPEEKAPEVQPAVAQPGKYKLLHFYPIFGRYFLYQPDNVKNVVSVAAEDVEYTVHAQELSAEVLSKETSKPVFIPESVENTLDAVRSLVLP